MARGSAQKVTVLDPTFKREELKSEWWQMKFRNDIDGTDDYVFEMRVNVDDKEKIEEELNEASSSKKKKGKELTKFTRYVSCNLCYHKNSNNR